MQEQILPLKTNQQAFDDFVLCLQPLYDFGEAKSIGRIVFEDVFNIYDLKSTTLFREQTALQTIKVRLLAYEPIQYILGEADFYGLKLKVNPFVLIPRQETEELVYWIIETNKSNKYNGNIADIGTGSGCIALALKQKLPYKNVFGFDISPGALSLAHENAVRYALLVNFVENDILNRENWTQLPDFEIIVSNPPYIPHQEKCLMPSHVLGFEPPLALFVEDQNPLIFYENIAEFALQKLNPQGQLFFETNEFNAFNVVQMLRKKGFSQIELHKDLNGRDRMVRCVSA